MFPSSQTMVRRIHVGNEGFLLQTDRWDWDPSARTNSVANVNPYQDIIMTCTMTATCGKRETCSSLLVNLKEKHIYNEGFDDIKYK